jgi:hypothetical protein
MGLVIFVLSSKLGALTDVQRKLDFGGYPWRACFPSKRGHLNADEHRATASLGHGPSRKHGHAPGGYNVTSGEWKLLLVLLVIASPVHLFRISKPDSIVCMISFL